jgi:hypothetical protein
VSSTAPLNDAEIRAFAEDWYRKLDVHAPMVEILPLLDENVECHWPEGITIGYVGFEGWYQRVIRIFFDEVHTVKEVTPGSSNGGDVEVKVVVNWQAKVWNPPDAKSKWLGMDAYQTWVVRRSATSGKPVIASYIVDKMELMPGSASL